MSDNKTKETSANVEAHIASKATPEQQADCQVLMAMLGTLTKKAPKMWGPSIVGFGSYNYKYESGRTGESCLVGFAVRGRELVLYLAAEGKEQGELLAKLGPHKEGKSCLYIKRLADIDKSVLKQLVAGSVAEVKRRHVTNGA
jgi:Domain of unknown function (DU1801)